ncbi:hypothetical protein [Clostridium sp.]|uniref:hypothetical protein n=1 Tax=Clostridium sp. TaxID=1506 RepID=UPI0026180532|nr:hypothetical protein [Clostridium sp.]
MGLNVQDIICLAIKNKKHEVIKEYDAKINQIIDEVNFVKVYYLLAETFHNTMEQGELGIKLLKENLTNDFFKEATVDNGVNYITFSNNEFDIMFSKSLSMCIRIKYKNTGNSGYISDFNDYKSKLANLIENYLAKKSIKNFKIMANYYGRYYNKNILAQIIKFINAYKKCNTKLLLEIKEQQEWHKIKQIEEKKKINEFEQRQLYAKNFINNLTDLEKFKAEGWYIITSGIKDEKGFINFF